MFTVLLRAYAGRAHPLAPATFQRIREVLRAAFNGAIRRGLITQNPACWVEIPRRGIRGAAQTAVFLGHVRGHVLYPLFHVAALLGLRRGEVIGLRWSDADFVAGTLAICRLVQERGGRAVVCLPKSERSGRTIALDHGTLTLLRRLHAEREAATEGTIADGWLFTHGDGAYLEPQPRHAHLPPPDPRR